MAGKGALGSMSRREVRDTVGGDIFSECVRLLVNAKVSEAKAMVGDASRWSDDLRTHGRRLALKGLVNMLNHKGQTAAFSADEARTGMIREMARNRQTSVWSDEFDKGYFEAWLLVLGAFERLVQGNDGSRQRVEQDPGKKKNHDEGS